MTNKTTIYIITALAVIATIGIITAGHTARQPVVCDFTSPEIKDTRISQNYGYLDGIFVTGNGMCILPKFKSVNETWNGYFWVIVHPITYHNQYVYGPIEVKKLDFAVKIEQPKNSIAYTSMDIKCAGITPPSNRTTRESWTLELKCEGLRTSKGICQQGVMNIKRTLPEGQHDIIARIVNETGYCYAEDIVTITVAPNPAQVMNDNINIIINKNTKFIEIVLDNVNPKSDITTIIIVNREKFYETNNTTFILPNELPPGDYEMVISIDTSTNGVQYGESTRYKVYNSDGLYIKKIHQFT
jgi:hypothetical protein